MTEVLAPLPGLVARVMVAIGQKVSKGDTVIVLNSMKTEVMVLAENPGVVKEILVKEWDEVDMGSPLVIIEGVGSTSD